MWDLDIKLWRGVMLKFCSFFKIIYFNKTTMRNPFFSSFQPDIFYLLFILFSPKISRLLEQIPKVKKVMWMLTSVSSIHWLNVTLIKANSIDCRDSVKFSPNHCLDINLEKNVFKPFLTFGICSKRLEILSKCRIYDKY